MRTAIFIAVTASLMTLGIVMQSRAQIPKVEPLTAARERALKPKDSFKECAACPQMVVVPAGPTAFERGRAPELWLIPAGQKPISVGMIMPDKPTTLVLDAALLSRLGPTALLAVSVEPIGGSPTGQPTGPVIAKGAISTAPRAQGHPARVANLSHQRGNSGQT